MTLEEMRIKLRKMVGNPTTTSVPDADLDGFLNEAAQDIGDQYRFHNTRRRCQFPTVVDTSKYGLPTDVGWVMSVKNITDGVQLEKGGDHDVGTAGTDPQSAHPIKYVRYRDYLELVPTPDAVYTIEVFYKRSLADMLIDAAEPVFPVTWHMGIVRLARFKYYEEVEDLPKSKAAWEFWQAWVDTKTNEVDEEARQIDSGVRIPTLEQGLDRRLDFIHDD